MIIFLKKLFHDPSTGANKDPFRRGYAQRRGAQGPVSVLMDLQTVQTQCVPPMSKASHKISVATTAAYVVVGESEKRHRHRRLFKRSVVLVIFFFYFLHFMMF